MTTAAGSVPKIRPRWSDPALIFALQGQVPQWGLVVGAVHQAAVVEEGGGPLSTADV